MQKLVQGIHRFRCEHFVPNRELYARLSRGQSPETLFITCSDSRINPNLLTHTEPGELFIIRNAGNIVPPAGAGGEGEEASLEFAVAGLGVKDIVICGHSLCGAMKALIEPKRLERMPAVQRWLRHAEATRRIITENYTHLDGVERDMATVQENVLVQLENVRTHPAVAVRIGRGDLRLHAWVFKIETGEVFAYQPSEGQFLPLTDVAAESAPDSGPRLGTAV
jgi:carbonic anhydrase